jgi:hypothetical protein
MVLLILNTLMLLKILTIHFHSIFYNFTSLELKFPPPITFNKGFDLTCDFELVAYLYHSQDLNIKFYIPKDYVIVIEVLLQKSFKKIILMQDH